MYEIMYNKFKKMKMMKLMKNAKQLNYSTMKITKNENVDIEKMMRMKKLVKS